MSVEIRETPFHKHLYGISKPVAKNQAPGKVMFTAMDETWQKVRANQIHTQGINHILYSQNTSVFAGVEIEGDIPATAGLEQMDIHFPRYTYYRLSGPYDQIPAAYEQIDKEITKRKLNRTGNSMEIYGHWSEDPQQLVTEILVELN